MFPNEARLRNLTYAAPIYMDLTRTSKTIDADGVEEVEEEELPRVFLGQVRDGARVAPGAVGGGARLGRHGFGRREESSRNAAPPPPSLALSRQPHLPLAAVGQGRRRGRCGRAHSALRLASAGADHAPLHLLHARRFE